MTTERERKEAPNPLQFTQLKEASSSSPSTSHNFALGTLDRLTKEKKRRHSISGMFLQEKDGDVDETDSTLELRTKQLKKREGLLRKELSFPRQGDVWQTHTERNEKISFKLQDLKTMSQSVLVV